MIESDDALRLVHPLSDALTLPTQLQVSEQLSFFAGISLIDPMTVRPNTLNKSFICNILMRLAGRPGLIRGDRELEHQRVEIWRTEHRRTE